MFDLIFEVIVSHLVCLVSMIASHLDFRKSSEPSGSPGLVQMTQNQVQELFHRLLSTKHLYHFRPPLHLLGQAFWLVCGVQIPPDGLGIPQERQKGISLGLPPLHGLGIHSAPALSQVLQRFPGLLLGFCAVRPLEILSQGLPVLLPGLVQGIPYRMQNTRLPISFGKDLLDRLL